MTLMTLVMLVMLVMLAMLVTLVDAEGEGRRGRFAGDICGRHLLSSAFLMLLDTQVHSASGARTIFYHSFDRPGGNRRRILPCYCCATEDAPCDAAAAASAASASAASAPAPAPAPASASVATVHCCSCCSTACSMLLLLLDLAAACVRPPNKDNNALWLRLGFEVWLFAVAAFSSMRSHQTPSDAIRPPHQTPHQPISLNTIGSELTAVCDVDGPLFGRASKSPQPCSGFQRSTATKSARLSECLF
ncbi:hypothetical protein AOQ84DRAFT_441548 [Glonium stellatum]|uniref:Secreted protein n=1 Tax=Glonium stellatum TaxID=574774 RepID=A0A8E2EVX5_9PEZI|nr:hypothetical protein AOQ84DRAFT_441548 [Glonium stellatum]